eukprot:s1381_g35.t1
MPTHLVRQGGVTILLLATFPMTWLCARPDPMLSIRGRMRLLRLRAEDQDTMGELFTKYYRLQEVNRNLAADTKIAVVSELLDVLDDLERGARLDAPDTGSSGQTLGTLAKKFESRLESLGFQRIEALGKTFDPSLHEAALRRPGAITDEVLEELRSGWMLGDRVVRPAVVAVAE